MTWPSIYSAEHNLWYTLKNRQGCIKWRGWWKSQHCFSFCLLSYNKPVYPNNHWNKHQSCSDSCDSFWGAPHFYPNQKPVSNHYQNCNEKPAVPSTQDGAARVVPATCPGKQEHLTVWDLSSILFLLQHRCAAITSQVPAFTWTGKHKHAQWLENNGPEI